jgi:TolB protein
VRELTLAAQHDALMASGTLPITSSGWCLLRAFSAKAEYPILDNLVYATTSPVYVSVGGAKPRSPEDARYFAAWVEHLLKTTAAYPDWNSAGEKAGVLSELQAALTVYQQLE